MNATKAEPTVEAVRLANYIDACLAPSESQTVAHVVRVIFDGSHVDAYHAVGEAVDAGVLQAASVDADGRATVVTNPACPACGELPDSGLCGCTQAEKDGGTDAQVALREWERRHR